MQPGANAHSFRSVAGVGANKLHTQMCLCGEANRRTINSYVEQTAPLHPQQQERTPRAAPAPNCSHMNTREPAVDPPHPDARHHPQAPRAEVLKRHSTAASLPQVAECLPLLCFLPFQNECIRTPCLLVTSQRSGCSKILQR